MGFLWKRWGWFASWVWIAIFIAVALVVAGTISLLSYRPSKEFVFAAGREDGAYYALAREYQAELSEMGYTMTILSTAGSVEILQKLSDGEAVVGFVQGGTADSTDTSDLESLASVFYESLWVFYNKDAFETPPVYLSDLEGYKLGIGEAGSGSAMLEKQVLKDNDITEENTEFIPLTTTELRDQLKAGDLDVALFVLAPSAVAVQDLMRDPNIELLDIKRGSAYRNLHPFLTEVSLDEGTIDLSENIPSTERNLLGTTTSLVARSDIAPDITRLLLTVAKDIHGPGGIYEEPGQFPSTHQVEIPMDSDAERFLEDGPTGLERYLPYWLASRLEWFIFVILPLLVILYPLLRNIPSLYESVIRVQIFRWYSEVHKVDRQIPKLSLDEVDEKLDWMEDLHLFLSTRLKVPMFYLGEVYELRAHINLVIERLEKRRRWLLAESGDPNAATSEYVPDGIISDSILNSVPQSLTTREPIEEPRELPS